MPRMGLGTWQLTHDTADIIAFALDLGYPMIDTSGDYRTQPGTGEGIERSGKQRSDFYLVTKVEETDDAYRAARKNLDELQLDHADPSPAPARGWRGAMAWPHRGEAGRPHHRYRCQQVPYGADRRSDSGFRRGFNGQSDRAPSATARACWTMPSPIRPSFKPAVR